MNHEITETSLQIEDTDISFDTIYEKSIFRRIISKTSKRLIFL